ncbi:MAG: IgGFc-binding protein [Candidatus Kapaibacterium sp.]
MLRTRFIAAHLSLAGFILVSASAAMAQQPLSGGDKILQVSSGIKITYGSHIHNNALSITTSDYWIAFPENIDLGNDPGKYIWLFISSTDSTTAYIEVGGHTTTRKIVPGKSASYSVPLSYEMNLSDTVENKAVHVWSNDAALFVDYLSEDLFSSEGTYVIPETGWGKEYVVASYASLFEGDNDTTVYDIPSEFVIISDQDSTIVTVTPSTDLRGAGIGDSAGGDRGPADSTPVVHPANQSFTVMLNRGQAVQYQAVATQAQDTSAFRDVTGTLIMASNPVGVVGASMCPNIPPNYPYCEFTCEMIPPVRTWGTIYYTAPLTNPFAKDSVWDTYLVIGSKSNQIISRTNSVDSRIFTTLSNPYDHYFFSDTNISTPSRWESTSPFLLMQYSSSSSYPTGVNYGGKPSMLAVNAIDHFSTPVIFNLFGNTNAALIGVVDVVTRSGQPVYLNGIRITAPPLWNYEGYSVYHIDSLGDGQNSIEADSGVTVSVVGSGYDIEVSYAGTIGVSTILTVDTIPPHVTPDTSAGPLSSKILASDDSGLSEFELDTLSNVRIEQDTNFINGNGDTLGNFKLVVVDSTLPAHATVRVLDLAGNYATVDKVYIPPKPSSVSNNTIPSPPASPSLDEAAFEQMSHWLQSGSGEAWFLPPTPNPANGNAVFNYALRNGSLLDLDLFDVLGHEELSIANDFENSGIHTISVDTRLLPSGTHIFRAQIGDEVHSGRLVVDW